MKYFQTPQNTYIPNHFSTEKNNLMQCKPCFNLETKQTLLMLLAIPVKFNWNNNKTKRFVQATEIQSLSKLNDKHAFFLFQFLFFFELFKIFFNSFLRVMILQKIKTQNILDDFLKSSLLKIF